MCLHARMAAVTVALVMAGQGALATTQQFATIGGGSTTDKLRFDPAGAENQGAEIGRFWQSTNSAVGNNFAGGCPSDESAGGWWLSSQAPLRGIEGWIGTSGCLTSGLPSGNLTLVVEEQGTAYSPGDTAFFIGLRVDETPGAVRTWDFSRVDPGPSPSVLPLVELPRLEVLSSAVSSVPGEVVLQLHLPDVAEAVHAVGTGDVSLPASSVVASYDLYRATGLVDPGRDASLWTLIEQQPYADGPDTVSVSVPCEGWLALGLGFDGGAGPDVPSALVGKPVHVECGNGWPPLHGIGALELGYDECTDGYLYQLRDLCDGSAIRIGGSSSYDLETYACQILELEGPDMFAGTEFCSMMDVDMLAPAEPPCLVQVRDLQLEAAAGTVALSWASMPCTDGYDLIRGVLPVTTDLGAVTCLADDVAATAAEDQTGDTPADGEAFFYLVRANGTLGSVHYGYTSSGEPRLPSSGDCP